MPSRGCRPEGPKYGKEAYFGYSGRHQVYMNFQRSHPLSPQVAAPGKVSTAVTAKIMQHCIYFYTYTIFNKLIFKKRQFLKIIIKLVYIYAYIFLVIFSLYSLLLWQKPILYSNVSIIYLFFFHQKAAEILAHRQH